MNMIRKRVISLVLCLVLATSYLPVSAFATENGETVTAETTEVTTEPTQAASEETEASSESMEATEPSTEATERSAEAPEPSTEATERSTEAPEPSTEATEPSTEATEPSTEATEPAVVAVTGITLDQIAVEVGVGELPMTLTATVLPEDATDKTVTWTSSEPGVVSVENGELTFGYMGTATVTATAGAFSASCTVTVGEGEIADYADNTTYVLAGSDFQNTFRDHSAGAAYVTTLLNQITASGYTNMDGFLFAGDYDYDYDDPAAGKAALQNAVQAVYGTDMHEVYVEGNHDSQYFNLVGTTLSASGNNDADEYGVYVIHESDYMWYNDDETTIKNTAAALDDYLDDKIAEEYEKPIFVISHLPLHYSMRTKNDGDGMYANYIFDVLNEAGAAGLNIIFLFGHNHSNGWDDYLGGAAVYLKKGDSINIAQASKTEFNVETLNFHYMNAGYVAYYRNVNTGSETDLTMTVFEITEDTVTVKRFSENGLHDLKSSGVTNSYKNESGYNPDTTVYASPQTIALNKGFGGTTEPEEVEQIVSGVTVKAPGLTDLKVGTVEAPAAASSLLEEGAVAYEITASFSGTASVTLPIPAGMDASRFVVYHVPTEGEPEKMSGSASADGTTYTFTTTHFSTYVGGEAKAAAEEGENVTIDPDNWVTITEPTDGTTTYTYIQATSITGGQKYVIVGNDHNVALMDNNGSMGIQSVTISGITMTSTTDLTEWTFSGSSSGTIYNGTRYLRYYNRAFSLSTSSTIFTITDNGSNFRIQSSGYSFYYNGSSWNRSSRNIAQYVRLYQLTDTTTSGGTDGLYGTIVGNTTYEVIQGTSEDNALAAVKAGIKVYYTNDNTATTGTFFEDNGEGMSWTFQNTYDPNTTGTYPVNVSYNGVVLGTVNVVVVEKQATSIAVSPMTGTVQRGSSLTTQTGSTMKVTYTDGTTAEFPVTLAMLDGSYSITQNGTYTGLTVSYGGQTAEGYTLNVVNVAGNNYPTYPNPGSVEVDKSATGVDFQNTGLARVELSTSGLPAGQGVDVVVVIDTSSSMDDIVDGKTRIAVLSESLEDMLEQFQKANTTTGQVPDIDIAIIDFNGYYDTSAGDYDKISLTSSYRSNVDYAKVFTGTNAGSYIKEVGLSAENFVDSTSITPAQIASQFTVSNIQSGTNYDGALENAYDLLAAKKEANGTTHREQYVIFLSDGAPFRYNGFNNGSTESTYATWNRWLTGEWANEDALLSEYSCLAYSYFYNGNGTNHPHRMAEAIKGNENYTYDVVVREAANNAPAYIERYQGLGAKIYSIGFCLAADKDVTVDTEQELIRTISSGEGYYYENVTSATQLTEAFTQIVTSISYAATNAVFEDQMGSAFDLQMNPTVKTNADGGGTYTVDTSITVTSQPVYTSAQVGTTVNGYTVKSDDVGKAYGTPTAIETVTFTADESGNITAASSVKSGNILVDGVICANTFFYNITSEIKTVTLANGSNYQLPGETFYWNIGTINEKQYTLSYLVYLTGSMDGKCAAGSYDTNNYATLEYTNYLGNDVEQSVPSPSMPWGGANVSYAFYLVDDNGNPLLQNGDQADNFLTAYKVTQPVLYQTVNLNAGATVLSAIGKDVLPDGYVLFDENAAYTVTIQSGDGDSHWVITSTTDVQSTYVMGYAGAQDFSNAAEVSENSYDYTHTTVYFAVKWVIGTVPDVVVIDYGLPVDISVLSNDMFGGNGTLEAVGAYTSTERNDDLFNGFAATYGGTYGKATVSGDKVRYQLDEMDMNGAEKFSYAVYYDVTDKDTTQYYYGTVTVIPATTIYYEDNFLDFVKYDMKGDYDDSNDTIVENGWGIEGVTVSNATQAEDRPGEYSLGEVDANNIYGYDAVNNSMSTHSLGSAAKVHVDANSYATATFTFYGTGFDVISMTSNTTGSIVVDVYGGEAESDTVYKTTMVDTYYGMDAEGNISANFPGIIYQVPVIKIFDMPYGQYTVVITATYAKFLDNTAEDGYDLYLDAIRIYDPAGTTYDETDENGVVTTNGNIEDVIQDAYIEDGEAWPTYVELRDNIIAASDYQVTESDDGTVSVTGKEINGVVFIDCNDNTSQIADYVSYGPNNELYLAPNQAIAFNVNVPDNVADIQLGIKVANGNSVTYSINGEQKSVNTTTDMYYSILSYAKSGTVSIKNTSGGILSLTNIKMTHTSAPAAESGISLLSMDAESVGYALMSLRAPIVEDEIPETTVPEETEPEETIPETTEPETTEPETEPTAPTVEEVVETVRKIVKKLFGWLFG